MGDVDRRRVSERLVDNAIAFGEAKQRRDLFFRCIGLEIETESNILKANRDLFGHGQRSAKIDIAFCANSCVAQRNFEGSRNRSQSYAGACDQ